MEVLFNGISKILRPQGCTFTSDLTQLLLLVDSKFVWIKEQFFVNCTKFSNHYNFLNVGKNISIAGKPRPSRILKWNIFWKKRIKSEKKNRRRKFSAFIENSYSSQNRVTKASIISDSENIVLSLIYRKSFWKFKREAEGM